jgi:ABC-type phosphate/phosphonate transport system substrate-binding protein
MTRFIANARMYAVAPPAEAAWRELLARVAGEAGVALDYLPYPAPQPLERLWSRGDLGAVFMCGYPIALGLAEVVPLAAPVPDAPWAGGRAVYRSDLIVRADSPWRGLADSFAGRLGWTVEHSHSGFNALRHHLMPHRAPGRERLYRETRGHLVTARRILDSVRDGTIDIGPLDAYWHMLIRRHAPELCEGIRILESTDTAPAPAFVCAPALDPAAVAALRAAFAAAAARPWFAALGRELCLAGFHAVDRADFAPTLDWDRAARSAGYAEPA